ncbi:BNR/Asp-box repeat protein [Candidatus Sulfotelmatomonas gaucii]|uniref:BNR/Asp-box repeat protein n=1 Tax=Candidatus Sulfuritelmatomonas gaucii TaxID=2043161 RepID=A0A2N9LCU5_9BACT|nr:BNR/Asp-box repeat protein [Candidatus Sulfotelmatomonas gaucii]
MKIKRRSFIRNSFVAGAALAVPNTFIKLAPAAEGDGKTNSVGMRMITLPSGSFEMGQHDGGWDERPVHMVTLTHSFAIGATEVTNAQYEQFDPDHKRGEHISTGDDDAVVNVSYNDAVRFTEWLSRKEGRKYRLPTEAEWEYGARAGTQTVYPTGITLPTSYWKYQQATALSGDRFWGFTLKVAQTPPNQFGLFDMLGNVEEWCLDWYGPYNSDPVTDPAGPLSGYVRVTRGGSFATELLDLRPAGRMAALPDDKHEKIGFRVVQTDAPTQVSGIAMSTPLFQQHVPQVTMHWKETGKTPSFANPRVYVKIPEGSKGPLYSEHNHFPSIIYADNGDLLATWYTCDFEESRHLYIAASRLRAGAEEWDDASLFFATPGRNDHSTALFRANDGKLYQFQGVGSDSFQTKQILVSRESADNGASWSAPKIRDSQRRMLNPHHVLEHSSGCWVMTSDFNLDEPLWGELLVSWDRGASWHSAGPRIVGQHPAIVELKDHSLMIAGRTNEKTGSSYPDGKGLPLSITPDLGKTWIYRRTSLPEVSWGQRSVLMRLKEGAILYIGFTDGSGFVISETEAKYVMNPQGGMDFTAKDRALFKGYGLFAAASYDEGRTWPVRRLITAGGSPKAYDGGGNTHLFLMDDTHAEPRAYLNAVQTPDGVVQLLSSRLHYQFNLAWLEEGTHYQSK